MSELMQRCDCRRPVPDHATKSMHLDAVQCCGCRGWVTGMMVAENPWGLSDREALKLFVKDGEGK